MLILDAVADRIVPARAIRKDQAVALPDLEPGWRRLLAQELDQTYYAEIERSVAGAAGESDRLCPAPERVFSAFWRTPPNKVKAVIIGQDPYHGPGQATGLAFSLPPDRPLTPSLRNIYSELVDDLGVERPTSGDLEPWAEQGVLLLNSTLTVSLHQPASHASWGWQRLTDAAIRELARVRSGLVFLLWGKHAAQKQSLIDPARHTVLLAAHPSPLSARRGFFGCRHFSACNEALEAGGVAPIRWQLPVDQQQLRLR